MARDIFPLGYHGGVTGDNPVDLVKAVNARGLRAYVKFVDDYGRAAEAMRFGDEKGKENVSVLRYSKQKGADLEAPNFDELKPTHNGQRDDNYFERVMNGLAGKTYQQRKATLDPIINQHRATINRKADEWWANHVRLLNDTIGHLQREGKQFDKRIWIEIANETDRNTMFLQGEMFAQIARKHAIPGGWRICVPGSNSGEPDYWNGWEDYLKLAARYPDQVSVSLHFYAWGIGVVDEENDGTENWDTYYPDHIGRESRLYEVCDELNIRYPTIHITEGGFAWGSVPPWSNPNANDYMRRVAKYMAERPNMTGMALWASQYYNGRRVERFVSDHIPNIINMVNGWNPPAHIDQGGSHAIPPEEPPPSGGNGGSGGNNDGSVDEGSGDSQGATAAVVKTKATGALQGLVAESFIVETHRTSFQVNTSVWFQFKIRNTNGSNLPYGGIGAKAYHWNEGEQKWKPFYWQHSWGGSANDALRGGEQKTESDHIKLTDVGIFALILGVTADRNATNQRQNPEGIQELQEMLEPIYLEIGSHIEPGRLIDTPPKPLFETPAGATQDSTDQGTTHGSTGGKTTGGKKGGSGKPYTGPRKNWTDSSGRHDVVYLLAPKPKTIGERAQLLKLALGGVTREDGTKTSGGHAITFSHDDAFNNILRGKSQASFVGLIAPERFGSGITFEWMMKNAANIPFEFFKFDGTNMRVNAANSGSGSRGPASSEAAVEEMLIEEPKGPVQSGSRGESGSGSGTQSVEETADENVTLWVHQTRFENTGTLGRIVNGYASARNEPYSRKDGVYIQPRAELERDTVVEAVFHSVDGNSVLKREGGYVQIRVSRSKMKPAGHHARKTNTGTNTGGGSRGTTTGNVSAPWRGRYTGPGIRFHYGVDDRADRHPKQADFEAYARWKFDSVLIQTGVSNGEINGYRSKKPNTLFVCRIYGRYDHRTRSVDEFVRDSEGDINTAYNAGVRYFQLLNEPNLDWENPCVPDFDRNAETRGADYEVRMGREYGKWHIKAARKLKEKWPEMKIGWGALSPGGTGAAGFGSDHGYRINDGFFLDGADAPDIRAISQHCDWISMHAYYQNRIDGKWGVTDAVNSIWGYRKRWPHLPVAVTEHCCNAAHVSPADQGRFSARFVRDVSKIPGIIGTYFYCISGSGWETVLRNEAGHDTGVIAHWDAEYKRLGGR